MTPIRRSTVIGFSQCPKDYREPTYIVFSVPSVISLLVNFQYALNNLRFIRQLSVLTFFLVTRSNLLYLPLPNATTVQVFERQSLRFRHTRTFPVFIRSF